MISAKLRCLIADDEPESRELIEKYVSRVPFLELVGVCNSANEALYQIGPTRPDLIFLDIEMPGISGFELLQLLPATRPSVIIVTGDPTYALAGYDQQVADYLLKPVSFERFLKAVGRVLQDKSIEQGTTFNGNSAEKTAVAGTNENSPQESKQTNGFLLLNENKKIIKVWINEIHLVEAMGDYLKVYWANTSSVIHMTMSKMAETLPREVFLRASRSNIINKNFIRKIEGNQIITLLDKKIPIGITYKNDLLAELRSNNSTQNE